MRFRWIKDLRVHEEFFGCYELPDRASSMLGKNTGVSVQIAAEQPKALSTHCQRHSLNLGIKATMTNSKQVKDVMGNRDHFMGKVLT